MTSAKKLRVSPEARDDLQEIWDYLRGFSVDAADKTIEAIGATFSSILDFPLMGRAPNCCLTFAVSLLRNTSSSTQLKAILLLSPASCTERVTSTRFSPLPQQSVIERDDRWPTTES